MKKKIALLIAVMMMFVSVPAFAKTKTGSLDTKTIKNTVEKYFNVSSDILVT